jgi:uncharacterized phiE125 gp8 family phage protein
MITVVTPPATEPLTVDEVKAYLRDENTTSQDDVIEALIGAARQKAEQQLGRYLVTQTLELALDRFPYDHRRVSYPRRGADNLAPYEILLPPLQSVASIKYIDTTGALQTLASNQYDVDVRSRPARVNKAYGVSWPATREQQNAVIIQFVAGYGTAEQVPQCVKQWMLLQIKAGYDNRDTFLPGTTSLAQLPNEYIDNLIAGEVVARWL